MNEVSSDTRAKALRAILGVMLDTVKEMGAQGAPAGVMYAAVCGRMSLAQFQAVMGALESAGKVRKSGHVYYFVADL
jgi:hypothetical protein